MNKEKTERLIDASFVAEAFLEGYKKALDDSRNLTIAEAFKWLLGRDAPKCETLTRFMKKYNLDAED